MILFNLDMEHFSKIKKFILANILKKKYIKKGSCKGCGKCCQNIYVNHGKKGFIKTEEEFFRLKLAHSFYRGLELIGKDEMGLLFKCKHLDYKTNRCKIHFFRPPVCRNYPMEEIFTMGGILTPDCGYSFEPVQKFKDVLSKLSK